MTTPALLTVDEAAACLRIAKGSLYNWISARRLTTVHIGRRVLIPEAEVARLIAAGTRYAVGREPVKPLAEAGARLRLLARQRRVGGTGRSSP